MNNNITHADPGAIDLKKAKEIYEAFKINPQSRHGYRERFMREFAPKLIAEVEALRERVVELKLQLKDFSNE